MSMPDNNPSIPAVSDELDRLWFLCPECDEILTVREVSTLDTLLHPQGETAFDNCTLIALYCNKCPNSFTKKFYWKSAKILLSDEKRIWKLEDTKHEWSKE